MGARLVSAAEIDDGIIIVTDRGELRGDPEGDCCSQSWIESVECDAPAGSLIMGFDDEAPGNLLESWADGDERKSYFSVLRTDRGRVTWEMRNESNGYYGGWINWTWAPAPAEEGEVQR